MYQTGLQHNLGEFAAAYTLYNIVRPSPGYLAPSAWRSAYTSHANDTDDRPLSMQEFICYLAERLADGNAGIDRLNAVVPRVVGSPHMQLPPSFVQPAKSAAHVMMNVQLILLVPTGVAQQLMWAH